MLPQATASAQSQVQAQVQEWRRAAPHVGSSARVLIVGTRPEDDDNALVAWLSLGRHVETAFLSLTRGESGANAIGAESEFPLGAVRTAEMLAVRKRDGARQYFTRAYDFGFTRSDSVVDAAWSHDSLLKDVVSVVRAFRPHVMIVLDSDSGESDATRRRTARLAAEAFAAAKDSTRLPSAATSRLSPWTVSRLFTRAERGANTRGTAIDVGEFDIGSGRSFAETGAEIRRLQRTQGASVAPSIGAVPRWLRLDSSRVATDGSLFGSIDTTLTRFRGMSNPELSAQLDSLRAELDALNRGTAGDAATASAERLASLLARVARRSSAARLALSCRDQSGVPGCEELAGDLAVTLNSIRERATAAMLGAAGIVVDGVAARQLVAAGDSVPVTVSLFNGGLAPVTVRRIAAFGPNRLSVIHRDTSIVLQPGAGAQYATNVYQLMPTYFWWQVNGLLDSTRMHDFRASARFPVVARLISGEDRIPTSGVEVTIAIDGIEVPIITGPIAYRTPAMLRGDASKPWIGVPPTTLLLDRMAEYERAGMPIDRLLRVYISSARAAPDTVQLSVRLPAGLRGDSLTRTVVLPPFTSRNLFYRVRGSIPAGTYVVAATAQSLANRKPSPEPPPVYRAGIVLREYSHIPSQSFIRIAEDRIEAVALRVPPGLRIAYVRGTEDLREPLSQLRLNVQPLSPLLLAVVDLSSFSTILVGSSALAGEGGMLAVPALQAFMRAGGTVVVLPGGDEIARSGLLPYGVTFGTTPGRVGNPAAAVRITGAQSQLLAWPNAMKPADFERWYGHRARGVPATFDTRYAAPLAIGEPGQAPITGALLTAKVGLGTIVYSALSLDTQLDGAHPGAARLLVNLLSAGLGTPKR